MIIFYKKYSHTYRDTKRNSGNSVKPQLQQLSMQSCYPCSIQAFPFSLANPSPLARSALVRSKLSCCVHSSFYIFLVLVSSIMCNFFVFNFFVTLFSTWQRHKSQRSTLASPFHFPTSPHSSRHPSQLVFSIFKKGTRKNIEYLQEYYQ